MQTPADVLLKIAARAKQLRKQMGYSQSELAERSDISMGSLRRFEQSGKISFESLLKIALILNRLNDFAAIFEVPFDQKRIERLFDEAEQS